MLNKYRPDIDGLRAIAVGSVVLFHAGVTALSGGFAGVDIFFVISGYLITANLHGDLLQGRFSIAGFYERRARRILPALFVMIIGAALGAAMFLPDALKLFGESAAATALSLSNVFFFRHTGYFDVGATISPLLHTWSLAVEEQFYLAFPPALWLAARLARGRRGPLVAMLGALWALSFVFSLWQVGQDQRAAFYLPFSRAWELLTGALLATGVARPPSRRWLREAGGAAGLALILATIFLLPSTASFPGADALPPCLGAALVIWAGSEGDQTSLAARLLQARPMVFLGLISYSLYLWHWPLLVFARYYSLGELGLAARAVVVALSLAVATASWWFVERPFRTQRLLARRRALFGACAMASLAICVGGGAVTLAKGLPQRLTPRAAILAAGADDHNAYRDHCFALTPRDLDQGRFCRIGVDAGRPPSLVIWGDSHADAMMAAFDMQAKAHGVSAADITHGSCPPLLGVEVHERADNLCPPLADAALALIERYDVRRVVLAGRWAGYAEGRLYQPGAPPVVLRGAGTSGPPFGGDNHAVFTAALERTLGRLRVEGRQVYIVLPIPEVDRPVADTLARAAVFHRTVDFAPTRQAYDARQRFVREKLDRLAVKYGVTEIDPAARLCDARRCRLTLDGRPLYYDTDHLSVHGALFIAPLVAPVFSGAEGTTPRIAAARSPDQRGASRMAPSSRMVAALR